MKMKGIRNEKWRFLNKYLLIDQRLQLATLLFSVLVHSSQGALPLAPRRRRRAAAAAAANATATTLAAVP